MISIGHQAKHPRISLDMCSSLLLAPFYCLSYDCPADPVSDLWQWRVNTGCAISQVLCSKLTVIDQFGSIWYIIANMSTLRELRLKKLWSQAKLARLSGVARTTIVAIENEQHTPRLLTIYRLANTLGVDASELNDHDKR